MTHVHEAIRNDQRLAIDLIIPGPPDMTITDVVGELYVADGMVGWVSTAVVGPDVFWKPASCSARRV